MAWTLYASKASNGHDFSIILKFLKLLIFKVLVVKKSDKRDKTTGECRFIERRTSTGVCANPAKENVAARIHSTDDPDFVRQRHRQRHKQKVPKARLRLSSYCGMKRDSKQCAYNN